MKRRPPPTRPLPAGPRDCANPACGKRHWQSGPLCVDCRDAALRPVLVGGKRIDTRDEPAIGQYMPRRFQQPESGL